MLTLLEKLCNAFGPSGYEDEVRAIIIDEIKDYATSYRVDAVGNLIVFKKGRKVPSYKRLFSAHMDEVGFMKPTLTKTDTPALTVSEGLTAASSQADAS